MRARCSLECRGARGGGGGRLFNTLKYSPLYKWSQRWTLIGLSFPVPAAPSFMDDCRRQKWRGSIRHSSSCRNILHLITQTCRTCEVSFVCDWFAIKETHFTFFTKIMFSKLFLQLTHSHQGRMVPLTLTQRTLLALVACQTERHGNFSH